MLVGYVVAKVTKNPIFKGWVVVPHLLVGEGRTSRLHGWGRWGFIVLSCLVWVDLVSCIQVLSVHEFVRGASFDKKRNPKEIWQEVVLKLWHTASSQILL